MKTVSFVGIGTMGNGMIQNLLKNGFKVIGCRKNKSKNKIKNKNFAIVGSASEVCNGSDIIITCLPSDSSLKGVLFSKNGILKNIKKQVLIDCGTTSVGFTGKIADECSKKKIEFLDAPMTGSKAAAENGSIFFMIGGGKKTIEKCRPVFDAVGKKIVYCGKNTYGQRAKIALNLGQALMLQSYIEALALGIKNGVPLNTMVEILENSGAKSGVSSAKIHKIIQGDFLPHFKLKLMGKDVNFAIKEMQRLGIKLPLSIQLKKVFKEALRTCDEDDDFSCIAKVMERNAGVLIKIHKP